MEKNTNSSSEVQGKNSTNATDARFDAQTKRLIRSRAYWLLKTGLFPRYMLDDITQSLSIVIYQASTTFDESKGNFHTYVNHILMNRAKNMIDVEVRKKAACSVEILNLDEEINEDQVTLGDLISDKSVAALLGKCTRSPYELYELRCLIRQAMDNMPEEYANICQAILDGETISSLARHFGITRSWFREKYFLPIRKSFLEVGLDQYLVEGLTYA